MNYQVSIDVDVVENMLKLHHRREKENEKGVENDKNKGQKCVFGLLLGVNKEYSKFHITDCIYRFIYYNTNYGVEDREGNVDKLMVRFF